MKGVNSCNPRIATGMLLVLTGVLSFSCGRTGTVRVETSETGGYPVLYIPNPPGDQVVLQPVSVDTGSIGFESGGAVTWVKGIPERSDPDENTVVLTWSVPSGEQVELSLTRGEESMGLELKLAGEEPPEMPSRWFLNLGAQEDEFFSGAMERVVDGSQNNSWQKGIETALNLRGERVEMKVKPTVSAFAPFYLSSGNYGLYVKGTWPGMFDFCKDAVDIVQVAFQGPSLSATLYLGPDPGSIVRAHALETGPSFVPPRWAFGPWRWRDEHNHLETYFDGSPVKAPYNSEIVEDVLMMKAYGIPCTAYWIDRPWGPGSYGFDDYDIDYERLPHFEEMIRWLNGNGMELMLWICPWVFGKMATTAKDRGYGLVAREMRAPTRMVMDSAMRTSMLAFRSRMQPMVIMDFTNPEARAWWKENGPGKLARMGIRGFKLDRADGERLVDSIHLFTASGRSYRENYNDYGRQFVQATYDAVQPVLGNNFMLFPRVQYTGSARYGGMWAGDTGNPPEGLRSVIIGVQRCAIMGYPVWGSDTGGYPKRMNRKVAMRWLGFSCFTPIMEVGPTNNRGFWGMDSEPSYDHELLAVWRFYTQLRMHLVDYLHHLATVASETGMPVIRPLFLEYPDQPESWKDWTTYKVGEDLLVSVIWEQGKTRKKVYLPGGERWTDLWSNQEYEGGQYVEVEAPLHQIPLFLREGSDLELPDLNTLYEESVEATSVEYRMSDLEKPEEWK